MTAIRPILSSLTRHKIAAFILIAEIALTCAILCNALDLIKRRVDDIRMPTGIAESHLLRIETSTIGPDNENWSRTETDLAAIRAVPGVADVSIINQVPLTNNSSNTGLTTSSTSQDYVNAGVTMADDAALATLRLKVTEGRWFTDDDMVRVSGPADSTRFSKAILTKALAEKLFPGASAVGKSVYMGEDSPIQVIGVVDRLMRPGRWMGSSARQYSLIAPFKMPVDFFGQYIVRVKDGADSAKVLKDIETALNKAYPRRINGNMETFTQMRDSYYAADRSMVWLLGSVAVILLLVTAFGIVGLASFWVQQRTKQIGIRRALGATKGDILKYFQTENFLIVTAGIVLGMLLAFGLNQLLMAKYEMPRLPWIYLPMGAVALWIIGQLAVLAPAMRASNVPPATATRTV